MECPAGFIYDGYNPNVECAESGYWNDIVHDCIGKVFSKTEVANISCVCESWVFPTPGIVRDIALSICNEEAQYQ